MKIAALLTIAVLTQWAVCPTLRSQTTDPAAPLTGVIHELVPEQRIALSIGSEAQPRVFKLRKTTQFVDAQGNLVALESIRQGESVSFQYVKDGEDLVVDRVTILPSAPVVQATPVVVAPPKVESIEGIITEFVPDSASLTIGSPKSSVPMKYQLTEETEFVDLEGNPIDRAAMELGRPVTVHYVIAGTDLVASRVVVGKAPRLVPAESAATPGRAF